MNLLRILLGILLIASLQAQDYFPNSVLMKVNGSVKNFIDRNGEWIYPLWLETKDALFVERTEQVFPFVEEVTEEDIKQGKVDLKQWFYVYFSPEKISAREIVTRLSKLPFVEVAELRYIQHPLYTPNDSVIGDLFTTIKALQAWDIEKGDSSVIVAVIDTGTEFLHEDLIGNTYLNAADPINGLDDDGDGYIDNYYGWDLAGCCLYSNSPDNDPSPGPNNNYHGTKVAGLAVATTDNNKGIPSTGFNCSLLPVKTAPDDAPNAITRGYEGIVYAANHGAKVINCSWGGYNYQQFGQDIINYAVFNRDALVVAAVGNAFEENKIYPASYENVLNVAVTRNDDTFPNTTYGYHVDISSPGEGITTDLNNTYSSTFGFYTSFASPVVAGAAALVKSHFPNYNALQVAEQLRVTADDIYGINPSFQDKLGKGRLNLYKALTLSSPSVRIENIQYSRTPIQSGDTISLFITLKNFLAPTTSLNVQLSSPSPYITVYNGNVNYGSINTLASKTNTIPFQFIVAPGAPANEKIFMKLEFLDGLYSDFQYFEFFINPTYVTLGKDVIKTTVNSVGKWGFNDFPTNAQGVGVFYNNQNYLFEGGFLLARKGKVADNIRVTNSDPDLDFERITVIKKYENNVFEKAVNSFQDTLSEIDLQIDASYYVYNDLPVVLFEFKIKNNSLQVKDSLFLGLFSDWDIGNNPTNDTASYNPAKKLAYFYDRLETSAYIGIQLLEGFDSLNVFHTTSAYPFKDSSKYEALINTVQNIQGEDIVSFNSVGPFSLPPLDSTKIVFALLVGEGYDSLLALADTSVALYRCLYSPHLALELGNDTTVCKQIRISAVTQGATSYLWNTGETSPVITVTSSGTYSVQVRNSENCITKDQINITVVQPPVPNYTISPKQATTRDTIFFHNNTTNSTATLWNFGDGYGSSKATASHVYSLPGTYDVSLKISNSHCDTVVWDSVKITLYQSLEFQDGNIVKIFPNPFSKRLIIETHAEILAVISDLQGKILRETKLSKGKNLLRLENLPEGIYLLRLSNQTENLYFKIVKQ